MTLTHRVYEKYFDIFAKLSDEEASDTEAGWIIENTDLSGEGIGTQLDDWQVFNLNNSHRYQLYIKSRQVGFSFIQSLKKLARCGLRPGYKGIFISIDRAESQEKLRYMNSAWDTLSNELKEGPLFRVKNNSQMVEYRNTSRCMSFPSKAPRGQSNSDLTIDEAAHVRNMLEKYNGSTAVAIRSEESSIEMGSSPLSATGFFYEVAKDPEKIYRAFDDQRFYVHWWDCTGLCRDVYKARIEAGKNQWDLSELRDEVEYRVNKYGTPALIDEFYSRSADQFRQEYECAFTSDNSALIAIAYLRKCADNSLHYEISDVSDSEGYSKPWVIRQGTEEYVKNTLIPRVIEVLDGISGDTDVYVGFDPASKRHQSVITFGIGVRRGGERNSSEGDEGEGAFRIRVIGRIAFMDTPIHVQEYLLDDLAGHPAIGKVCIDRTGHAIDLCDRLEAKYGEHSVFEPFNFSAKLKSEIGSRMQFYFEQGLPWYPYDKDLINQIYALKRIVTKTGQESIQAPESQDHHADGGWSMGLMMMRLPVPEIRRETRAITTDFKSKDEYAMRQELHTMLAQQIREERYGPVGFEAESWWEDSESNQNRTLN